MNVKKLSNKAAKEVGVTQATAKAVADALIANIVDALIAGETVCVRGIMSLSVKRNDARERYNPQTGEHFMGKPTARIKCKTSKQLKALLNDKL